MSQQRLTALLEDILVWREALRGRRKVEVLRTGLLTGGGGQQAACPTPPQVWHLNRAKRAKEELFTQDIVTVVLLANALLPCARNSCCRLLSKLCFVTQALFWKGFAQVWGHLPMLVSVTSGKGVSPCTEQVLLAQILGYHSTYTLLPCLKAVYL